MLSLIEALEVWRHYLLGAEVKVYTDNSALKYLQHNPKPVARQVRWLEKLQQFTNLQIVHIPGKANTAADALSRHPEILAPESKVLGEVQEEKPCFLSAIEKVKRSSKTGKKKPKLIWEPWQVKAFTYPPRTHYVVKEVTHVRENCYAQWWRQIQMIGNPITWQIGIQGISTSKTGRKI